MEPSPLSASQYQFSLPGDCCLLPHSPYAITDAELREKIYESVFKCITARSGRQGSWNVPAPLISILSLTLCLRMSLSSGV
jgi:hypothetical protein